MIPVQSWCRICGFPVLLEVLTDYDLALAHFHALDDQPMAHKRVHAEVGGWGVHWRLDDVLSAVFPTLHEEAWPRPVWYEHNEADADDVVVYRSHEDAERSMHMDIDVELRMLKEVINRRPRNRDELSALHTEVWDTTELGARFEILGFKSPFAIVRDKRDGRQGSVLFQHEPRLYFNFDADRVI